jgi:hypothetical protein
LYKGVCQNWECIYIAGKFISTLCTRNDISQCTVGNTRDNGSAFHGHEELVSFCSLKNIMTGKDTLLKIWLRLTFMEVSWEKLTMATGGGRNMYGSKIGVVERIS